MRRTYTAQILSINRLERVAFLNIDLGFRIWHPQTVDMANEHFWKSLAPLDWIRVNIYQRKRASLVFEAIYTYDAVALSKTKEPRTILTG